jgi:hypothetical protein
MVKGRKGSLDRELEAQGLFLRAQTYRDYMVVSVEGPNNRIEKALEAIGDVLQPLQTSQTAIDQEVSLIASELAISSDLTKLSAAAWTQVYGERGLDPLGNTSTMLKAKPSDLTNLQKRHFAPRNVVLAVCGDFDLNAIAGKVKKIIGAIPEQPSVAYADRIAGKPGRADCDGAFGELRAAPVGSCLEQRTLATLVAGFAVCTMNREATLTYTFTNRNGVVSIGQTADSSGMGIAIDKMDMSERASLYEVGKRYAQNWISSLLAEPAEHTRMRGILIATGSNVLPEEMLDSLKRVTMEDYAAAFERLSLSGCTVASGASR